MSTLNIENINNLDWQFFFLYAELVPQKKHRYFFEKQMNNFFKILNILVNSLKKTTLHTLICLIIICLELVQKFRDIIFT